MNCETRLRPFSTPNVALVLVETRFDRTFGLADVCIIVFGRLAWAFGFINDLSGGKFNFIFGADNILKATTRGEDDVGSRFF